MSKRCRIAQTIIEKYKCAPANYRGNSEQFTRINRGSAPPLPERKDTQSAVGARIPDAIHLHDYQEGAIAAWVGENYRGIFDMATGTGKTYTGLGALAKFVRGLMDRLAVIIVCPYQHLVEQWVEDIVRF